MREKKGRSRRPERVADLTGSGLEIDASARAPIPAEPVSANVVPREPLAVGHKDAIVESRQNPAELVGGQNASDAKSAVDPVIDRRTFLQRGTDRRVTIVRSTAAGLPCLVQIYGNGMGRMLSLPPDSTATIGRSPVVSFPVDGEGISRVHCEMRTDWRGVATVVDRGSTNGTWKKDRKSVV